MSTIFDQVNKSRISNNAKVNILLGGGHPMRINSSIFGQMGMGIDRHRLKIAKN